ncbi:hypothetical protein E4U55_000772 [Claviceps digitariae]|nr:hypothetical protein E4U55_000772 [Claviceps digitariae]
MGSKFSSFPDYRIEYDRRIIHIPDANLTLQTAHPYVIVTNMTYTSSVANELDAWARSDPRVASSKTTSASVELAPRDLQFMEAIFESAAQDEQGQRLQLVAWTGHVLE